MRILAVFVFFVLFPPAPAAAQEMMRTDHYTTADGMISNVTYSCMFDRNNYLWICTDRGLSRFDGMHFTHFTIAEGLPDNDIIYVTEDDEGTIWAQPFQREVAFLETNKSVFTSITALIPQDIVESDRSYRVFRLRDGKVGLLSTTGTVRIIRRRKWIASYRLPMKTISWAFVLFETRRNGLQLLYHDTTMILEPKGKIRIIPNTLTFNRFEMDGDFFGLMRVGQRSIDVLDRRTETVRTIALPSELHRFGLFRSGLLMGTIHRHTAYVDYRTGKVTPALPNVLLSFAAENRNGRVQALCTADDGVYIRTFSLPDQYLQLRKSPYYFYLDKRRVLAADGTGKVVFPNGATTASVTRHMLPTIPLLAESVGTRTIVYGGEFLVLENDLPLKKGAVLPGSTKDVYLLNDSIRYIASSKGVYEFNRKSLAMRLLYEGRTTAVSAGANGSVFIGTHWGLQELRKDGSLFDWSKANRIPNIRIVDMAYRNGVLWLATAGKGLLAICRGRVTSVLTQEDGISRNMVMAVEGDEHGHVFVGYADGAQKLTYALRNNSPMVRESVILKTRRTEGIRQFLNRNGRIYGLGNDGIFVIDPDKNEPVRSFGLRITRVLVNDSLREVAGSYRLRPGDYDFEVAFSTINFDQFPVRYRYRLNNGAWKYTPETEIRYTNLSAGTYTITVQVLNNYCRPSQTIMLTFDVAIPFFRQTAFLLGVVLLLVAGVFFLARHRFRKRYRKEREALIQANKLGELELIALKAQINPHFVFNCLNTIKGLMYRELPDEADRYIDRFAELFRSTLEASSHSYHSVTAEMAYLRAYLEMEQISVNGRFDFTIDAHGVIDPEIPCIPPMLLQPYVENAIKHGVLPLRDRTGTIRISVVQETDRLICTVSDNGAGRAPLVGRHAGNREPKGMSITQKRAALYHIQTEITDHPVSGTVVRLVIPFPQSTRL